MATLIRTFGGPTGFGEQFVERNDDGSWADASGNELIDLTSVFPEGLNFFGTVWTGLYLNNNGNVTFTETLPQYTPSAINSQTDRPIIAAFFADVDTRGTAGGVTPGGTSQGTNLLWWDLDASAGTFTATWDDVGYFSEWTDKLNAFQLQLRRVGASDFDIVFLYETIDWTTGDASGGEFGLGGEVARAGYSSGDGANYFELPQSGEQAAILDLEHTGNTGQDGVWVFQVRNGAPVLQVSVGNASMAEGDGPGTKEMRVEVVLSSPSAQPVVVDYHTEPQSAGPEDFVAQAGSVTFLPGQTRQPVLIEVRGDRTMEADETFRVVLDEARGAGIADASAIATILNDDGLSVSDVRVVEGSGEDSRTATFEVRLLSALEVPVSVHYATAVLPAPGAAQASLDFVETQGDLVFAPGTTSLLVQVPIVADRALEPEETFRLVLSAAQGAAIADGIAEATIVDDDGFVVDDVTHFEGSGGETTPFTFTVRLLSALDRPAQVNYQTVGLSPGAGSGTDFVPRNGTLQFAAGVTEQTVTVEVLRDSEVEGDERFELRLSNPTGSGIADGTGVGTVVDDDGLFVADASVAEGDEGEIELVFMVTLGSPVAETVTVDYRTEVAGSASDTGAGRDFVPIEGSLEFAPGETVQAVYVIVESDVLPEPDETLVLSLSDALGTGIVDGAALGTIRNDDGLAVASAGSQPEGNAGTDTMRFVVSLNAPAQQLVTVDYTTEDGTAGHDESAGSPAADYGAVAGRLQFAPGELVRTVDVPIRGDALYEPDETFRLVLSNPVGSRIVTGTATARIANDDERPPPALYVSDVRRTEGSGTGTAAYHFQVWLSRPQGEEPVTVRYATNALTATAGTVDGAPGADFVQTGGTLVFRDRETVKDVVVTVIADTDAEPDETFELRLSHLEGPAVLGDAVGVATILNDDLRAPPVVTGYADDTGASDSDHLTRDATQTLTMSADPGVRVEVIDGSTSLGFATETAQPGVYTFTTAPLQDGVHPLRARAWEGEVPGVYGAPATVTVDTTRPTIEAAWPRDGFVGVPVNLSLRVQFTESLVRGEGELLLRDEDGRIVQAFDVAADTPALWVSGNTLFVDPTAPLEYATRYRLEIPPGALRDLAGNTVEGSTSYDFTTDDYAGSAGTRGRLAAGGSAIGRIEVARDSDWFAADLAVGNRYDFRLEGSGALDPVLVLRDANGRRLDYNDDSGGSRDSAILQFEPAANGRYYLGVAGTTASTGAYTLAATATPIADDYTNNFATTGRVSFSGTGPGAVGSSTGRIERPGDADMFAVSLVAGQAYQFRVTGTSLADPFLRVYDRFGLVQTLDDNSGGGTDALVKRFVAVTTEDYYLQASDRFSGTGRYQVSALKLYPDDYADDTTTTGRFPATYSPLEQPLAGKIDAAGDVDWFKVDVQAGKYYEFEGFGRLRPDTTLGSPALTLYTAAGTELARGTNAGQLGYAELDFVADRTGTLYVAVSDASGGTGTYKLARHVPAVDDFAGNASTRGQLVFNGTAPGSWDLEGGSIESAGDDDWFKVDLAVGRSYEFSVTGWGLDEPVLTLYSPAGTALLTDPGGDSVADGKIRFNPTTTGPHYLGVVDAGDDTGRYMVSATVTNDDYGDNPATNGRLALGGSTTGRIQSSSDVDWFAITLDAAAHYTFRAERDGSSALDDPYLSLYDGSGVLLGSDDEGGGNRNALLAYDPAVSGTYYLEVRHAEAGGSFVMPPAGGGYKLSARGLLDDDYANDALTTGQVGLDHPASGRIDYAGDRDWIKVQLLAGGVYRFDLDGDTLGDPFLALYAPGSHLVVANDDRADGDLDSTIVMAPPVSGLYYLEASGFDGSAGSYTLSVSAVVPVDDYPDSPATRGFVPPGGSVGGRIDVVNDCDWFAVGLVAGVPYRFRLDSDGILDPYLRLIGPGGTRVAYDDDSGGSNNSVFSYTPTASGTYYLAVNDVALSTGGYTLRAEQLLPPADDSFSIEVVFVTNTIYDDFFTAAAQRWEEVITSDLRDASDGEFGTIDDLLIRVDVPTIDGVGGILGQANVDNWRGDSEGGLPSIGHLRLDLADVANMDTQGTLENVILHEMGHVLGLLASGFSRMDLLDPGDPYRYVGTNAVTQYRVVAGDLSLDFVPIESDGGDGTRKHHWDEDRFGNEMMTGWIESVPPQPISIVTVGALADLGYGVDYAAADPYHL